MIRLFGYPGGYPNVPTRLAEEQRIVWFAERLAETEQHQEQEARQALAQQHK
jgi:hypothetical protein